VLQRDGYRCVVCGALTREVHHVRPMILGGVELPPLAEVEARCRRHNPRGPTQG
jgi:5-methylcytosine-specific restriction endonuclease McrA